MLLYHRRACCKSAEEWLGRDAVLSEDFPRKRRTPTLTRPNTAVNVMGGDLVASRDGACGIAGTEHIASSLFF